MDLLLSAGLGNSAVGADSGAQTSGNLRWRHTKIKMDENVVSKYTVAQHAQHS